MGITLTNAQYALWQSLFRENQGITYLTTNMSSAKNVSNVVKFMYETLPEWLKPGVTSYCRNLIEFENGSRIEICGHRSSDAYLCGRVVNLLCIDDFAFADAKQANNLLVRHMPMVVYHTGRIIISSSQNGKDNLFYEMYKDSEKGENKFSPIRLLWDMVPNRDEKWKKEMIRAFGEAEFNREYECKFI
jgi:hypothetical protein